MPFRPGLDDDDALEELIQLWTDGANDLKAKLAQVYARVQVELTAATVNENTVYRLHQQAKRLLELQGTAWDIADDLAQRTQHWIETGGMQKVYLAGAQAAMNRLELPFSFTQPHRAAVEVLSKDLFSDVLVATKFVEDDAKRWVREVGRKMTGFKLTGGTPVKAQARRFEQELRGHFLKEGMGAVTYRDGSRHSFGEYAEMLLRTKTGVAYNTGTLNASKVLGIEVFELLDGAECGLTSHFDPEKANGRLVSHDFAMAYPLAHPNCRRAIVPRPDMKTVDDPTFRSVQSPEARADQAAFEKALAAQSKQKAAQRRSQRPGRPQRGVRLSKAQKEAKAAQEARRAALKAERAAAQLEKAKAQGKLLRKELDDMQEKLQSKMFANALERAGRVFQEDALKKWDEAQELAKAAAKAQAEKAAAEAAAKKAAEDAAAKKAAANALKGKSPQAVARALKAEADKQGFDLLSLITNGKVTAAMSVEEQAAALSRDAVRAARKQAEEAAAKAAAEKKAKKSEAAKKAAATRKRNKEARLAAQRVTVKMPVKKVPDGVYQNFKTPADIAKNTYGWPEGFALKEHEVTLKEWLPSLTPSERSAVEAYTGNAYYEMNRALFQTNGDIAAISDSHVRSQVANLKAALDKHPLREEPVFTYRGVKSNPSFIADMPAHVSQWKEGQVITQPAFTSASLQPMVAQNFASLRYEGNVIYKIKTHSAANIIELSGFGFSEAEVLFNTGTMLRVVKPFDPVTKVIEFEEVI